MKRPPKESGLTTTQWRILRFMLDTRKPMTAQQIAEGSGVDGTTITPRLMGGTTPELRKRREDWFGPSLLTMGLITAEIQDHDGRDKLVYNITKKGIEVGKKVAAYYKSL